MSVKESLTPASSERALARRRMSLIARRNYDLLLLIGLALLLPGLVLLPIPVLRIPLGLGIVLLAPGYALVAALFPRRDDLDGAIRAALSFGLSVAVLPVLVLVLNLLPWGIRPWPIAISLAICLLLLCGIGLLRRRVVVLDDKAYTPPVVDVAGWWRGLNHGSRARYVLGVIGLGAVLIGVVIVLLGVGRTTRLTEFYILGSDGLAESYPRVAAPGQAMQILLGIINHEEVTTRYRVEVRSGGQLLSQIGPIVLEDGATWERPLRYALAQVGDDQSIDILLFYNDATTPYRQLRLWVDVRDESDRHGSTSGKPVSHLVRTTLPGHALSGVTPI